VCRCRWGKRKEAIYQAASIVGAGTITELVGIEAIEKYKDNPKYKDFKNTIAKFNEAVDGTIASYFAGNKYNLTSVLTQNVGGYDANSFIYDRDEADKDKTKILLKIDPNTKIPVMDESAPHFAEQKKEAEDWVRNQIMNRLDSERKITTTAQSQQLREPTPKKADDPKDIEAKNFGLMLAYLTTGNAAQKQQAADYFKAIPGLQKIDPNTAGIDIYRADGSKLPFFYDNAGVRATPEDMGRSIIKELNKQGYNEDIILQNMRANIPKGAQIDPTITASGVVVPKFVSDPVRAFNTYVAKIPDQMDNTSDESKQAEFIRNALAEIPDITVAGTGTFSDYVTVYYKEGTASEKKREVSTNEEGRKTAMAKIKKFLSGLNPSEKTAAGMVESEGVGSQY
jgi:hypothetical protein